MRLLLVVGLVIVLSALAATATAADTDLKALIDRIMKAHGGAEELAKPRAFSYKEELTTARGAVQFLTRSSYFIQPPGKYRLEGERTQNGKVSRVTQVFNGTEGWWVVNGESRPLPRVQFESVPRNTKSSLGYQRVLSLNDPVVTAKLIGESKLDGKAVVSIQLDGPWPSPADRPAPVDQGRLLQHFYFDQPTLLLWQYRAVNLRPSGEELHLTTQTWEDYRRIDGIAVAHRITDVEGKGGGVQITNTRVYRDFRFAEALDPKLFEKP